MMLVITLVLAAATLAYGESGESDSVTDNSDYDFCVPNKNLTVANVLRLRPCRVIVGNLILAEINFTLACGGESGSAVCDSSGLFPNLTDITGYLSISNVLFYPDWTKCGLASIFPRLAIIHGMERQPYSVGQAYFGPVRGAIVLVEVSNLQYLGGSKICVSNKFVGSTSNTISSSSSSDGETGTSRIRSWVVRHNAVLCANVGVPEVDTELPLREPDSGFRELQNCLNNEMFSDRSAFSLPSMENVGFLETLAVSSCPVMSIFTEEKNTTAESETDMPCAYDCDVHLDEDEWQNLPAIPCLRVCRRNIFSLSDMCFVDGCTHFSGDLLISLPSTPTNSTRESAVDCSLAINSFQTFITGVFSTLRVINGSLILSGVNCLRSLDFLSDLQEICGDLILKENRLLGDFGGFNTSVFRRGSGNVIIARNPRLCLSVITNWTKDLPNGVATTISANGYEGSCINCLTFDVAVGQEGTTVVADDTGCLAELASEYPDINNMTLSQPEFSLMGRDLSLGPEEECTGERDGIQDFLPSQFSLLTPSQASHFHCDDELNGWGDFGFLSGIPFFVLDNLIELFGTCTCQAVWIRATIFDMETHRALRLFRSKILIERYPLPATPAFNVTNVSSQHVAPSSSNPLPTVALKLTWEVTRLGCDSPNETYGLFFRAIRTLTTTSYLRTDDLQCAENLRRDWTAVSCAEPLVSNFTRRDTPIYAAHVVHHTVEKANRSRVGSTEIPGLTPGTLYQIQVRVIVDTVFNESFALWQIIPPNLTWTEPISAPYNTTILITLDQVNSKVQNDTTSAIIWSQDPMVLLVSGNLSVVNRYNLAFSSVLSSSVLDANIRLCNASFQKIFRQQGCYPCPGSEASCESSTRYECNVQCSEVTRNCTLSNLTIAWCSLVFYNLTLSACDGTETPCQPIGGPFPFLNQDALYDEDSDFVQSCITVFGQSFVAPRAVFFPQAPRTDQTISAGLSPVVTLAISIAVPALVVLVIFAVGRVLWTKMTRKTARLKEQVEKLEILAGTDFTVVDYSPDDWEIDPDQLELHEVLGEGAFGVVYMGVMTAKNSNGLSYAKQVAVKTLKVEGAYEKNLFLQEASIMKKFDCPYIVRLSGIVSTGSPKVAMECMSNGDLKNYLRSVRKSRPSLFGSDSVLRQGSVQAGSGSDSGIPSTNSTMLARMQTLPSSTGQKPLPEESQYMAWASQLAVALQHLVEKRFVHRDISARNCMLDSDLTLKIADFGLSRDIYSSDYYRKLGRGALPLRWLPPEALRDGVYSSATDVWSYGIVLYEMATLAELPYRGKSNEDVMEMILHGEHLPPPLALNSFPSLLLGVMEICWTFEADLRPTMEDILVTLNTGVVPLVASREEVDSAAGSLGPEGSGDVPLDTHEDIHDLDLPEEDLDGSGSKAASMPDLPEEDLDGSVSLAASELDLPQEDLYGSGSEGSSMLDLPDEDLDGSSVDSQSADPLANSTAPMVNSSGGLARASASSSIYPSLKAKEYWQKRDSTQSGVFEDRSTSSEWDTPIDVMEGRGSDSSSLAAAHGDQPPEPAPVLINREDLIQQASLARGNDLLRFDNLPPDMV